MDKDVILSDYFLKNLTVPQTCKKYGLSDYEVNSLVSAHGAPFLMRTLGKETIKNILEMHINYNIRNHSRKNQPLSKKLGLPSKTITHIYNKFKTVYAEPELEPLLTLRCINCQQLYEGKLGDSHANCTS